MGAAAGDQLGDYAPGGEPDTTFSGDLTPPLAPGPSEPEAAAEAVADDELEAAFANAESLQEEMMDANRIAEEALRASELDDPEGFQVEAVPTYATETMARLLDEQGDGESADAIRARLRDPDVAAAEEAPVGSVGLDAASVPMDGDLAVGDDDLAIDTQGLAGPSGANGSTQRERVIATLEGWLENLRRSHV